MTRLSSSPRPRLLRGVVLAGLLLLGRAAALPAQQATPEPYPAPAEVVPGWPTPDESGAVTVVIQPGDSLWALATRFGLSVQQLAALNGLGEDAGLIAGQTLIIGYDPAVVPPSQSPTQAATPEAPTLEASTPEPPPTDTPPPPTPRPTQPRPQATICLSAFDDLNGDSLRDEGEPLRAGVAFTIYNDVAVVANYITDGVSEPKCLGGLSPGQYYVTRSIAAGERLTTDGNWALSLTDNSTLRQDFGSVTAEAAATPPPATSDQLAAAEPIQESPSEITSQDSVNWPRAYLLLVGIGLLLSTIALFWLSKKWRASSSD